MLPYNRQWTLPLGCTLFISSTILYWVLFGNFMEFPWLSFGCFRSFFPEEPRQLGRPRLCLRALGSMAVKMMGCWWMYRHFCNGRHGGKSTPTVVVQYILPSRNAGYLLLFEWKSGTMYGCFTFWYMWLQTPLAEDFSSQVDQVQDAELYILKDCCDTVGWSRLHNILGGGFKYFLFSPLPGEDSHFDSYFSNGLKPPTSIDWSAIVCVYHFFLRLNKRRTWTIAEQNAFQLLFQDVLQHWSSARITKFLKELQSSKSKMRRKV